MRYACLRVSLAIFAAIALLPLVGRTADPAKPRPADWAVKVDRPGLPNLNKINDNLYRSAQPKAEGIAELEKLGVKTVLNLRSGSGSADKKILVGSKLGYAHIPMDAGKVNEKNAVDFLKIVTDPKRQPVLVHCQAGADRTGSMCAVYRVVVEGWSKEKALDEMVNGGYNFHPWYTNLPEFIRKLDVEKIKAEVGLKEPKATKK